MSAQFHKGAAFDDNPLRTDSAAAWDALLEAIGPASLIVVIESRMGEMLRRHTTAEDIWQDTLLHVWRDRHRCEWRGLKAFRSWVLSVIDNRIRDTAARASAAKRGGGQPPIVLSSLTVSGNDDDTSVYPGPPGSTTPSRMAMHKEQARAMRAALDVLPDASRDIVRMRLFDQLSIEEIAERVGLGPSAVRHRFRAGAQSYRSSLMSEFASRSRALETAAKARTAAVTTETPTD